MVGAQALFAAMNICTRLGARGLPWSEVAAARFLLGGVVAASVALARGVPLRVRDRRTIWGRSGFGAVSSAATFYVLASPRMPVGDAVTVLSLGPIFVALLSRRLLGERVGTHVGIAVVVGFAGAAAVVRPSFAAAHDLAAIAVAGAFVFALAMIWLRRIGPGESAEAIALHFSLTTFALMAALTIPVWRAPDRTGALLLAATGVFGGVGQLAMTRAYALANAAPVSALTYLSVVFTYGLAVLTLADHPAGWQLGGALLVAASGLMLAVPPRRPANP